ncbi:putative lipoprotein [Bacteroides xylanisolvens SD CC 2a]|uniref:Lipoprotein n=1 Tax=Bacteroides xylanisolvens SD CC 1b TaxID=702447 RepID=W6NYF3_9BACE|nr:hypothetical protein HMPREF0102_04105 [Bacteroides sp. 2_1_22]EFF55617.1 putative lipoprotein [Bacteroides xylanisolvens SD CC 2a]CDM00997.1 hypothetical protein BN891_39280 [Bacteroides xylanisolvens SD CC 2a]CDM02573.1 hypothetical protein BN890_1190 [Bacteroides xylanisolvens SD CC 1b]
MIEKITIITRKKCIRYVTFCYISFVLTVGCAWNRFFLYFCR